MRIPITCGSCGRDFSAPESHAGRKVVCPDCGAGVKVQHSGIATPRNSDDDSPRSGARRARGAGPNPKIILGILGLVAVVAAVAVGMKNLPDLSQMQSTVVTPPSPTSGVPGAQPANAAAQPGNAPDGRPAVPAPTALRPPESELEAKRKLDEAVRKAPEQKSPISLDNTPKVRPVRPASQDRSQAEDEVDTDRGQRLLGRVKTIVLVREGPRNNANFDPRGAIAKRVTDRAKTTLEKAGVKVSISSPGPKSAVLKLSLKGKPSPVGTRGTQEITLSGELICFDSKATGKGVPYVSVWKHEESLGTIARQAARSGKVPEKLDRNIGEFVNRLRVAWQQAEKVAREAGEDSDEAGEDDSESMASDSAENAGDDPAADPEMSADESSEDAAMDEEAGEESAAEEKDAEEIKPEEDAPDESREKKKSSSSR